jgi:predicted TIM-barrel fold metal-dependent hydrolase
MSAKIIDSHMHCGIQNSNLPFEDIKRYLDSAGIQGACLFAPVEDIYDRYEYDFKDNFAWVTCREHANHYVLDIQKTNENFFAYYFVWNDFRKDELKKGYKAIKWHRHEHEPVYHYDDPLCEAFLQEVYRQALPIVLEESFDNTRYFIRRVKGRTPIIIPHMGGLNGGFTALFSSGMWDDETIYADTALASGREISAFLDKYGSDRLLFGSDFPFGTPGNELQEVIRLNLGKQDFENIVCHNILRLLKI